MEDQRKWSGWLLIAIIVVISGSALVFNTLASSRDPLPLATESPLASTTPTQPANPQSQSLANQGTANASVIGYGGPVLARLTMDTDGRITALDIGGARFQETEGIGSRVKDPGFAEQFIGQQPPLTLNQDVDAIAGASVSSQAVVDAVNEAAAFLKESEKSDASDAN